jgi:hypothetical protein
MLRCAGRVMRCVPALAILATLSAAPAFASTTVPSASASPARASGSLGIQLLEVPVTERSDPRALVYIVDHLAPGSVIQRRLEVSNSTDSTLHVALFAAAATIANGSFIGSAGHTANSLSTWTTVSPAATTLPAGGRAVVTVTITIPQGASDGEQYGVVWAEVQSSVASGAGGITEISRVGIRIYLSVGRGEAPASNFTINSLTAERSASGPPMVIATVHNTGGLALDMSGALRLVSGPGGLSAGPFPASLGTTLAIGDTEPVTIVLNDKIPAGRWEAEITLRSGLIQHSARATISFPRAGATAKVFLASPRSGSRSIPIVMVFIALLIIASGVLVARRRHLGR